MLDEFAGVTRFSFPTTIVFGAGAVAKLGECLGEVGVRRPLIVTDPGLAATDVVARVRDEALHGAEAVDVFDKVHGNPLEEDVEAGVAAFLAGKCDGVIGLGGGSPLDVAKAVAVRAVNAGPLARFDVTKGGHLLIEGTLPPIVAIPTTAGTGSEVGRSAVVTIPSLGKKIIVFHPQLMPKRAILDPELTFGLPPRLTAATGMDAFTHHIESLTAPIYHPMCDAIALHGMELVVRNIERATKDGRDVQARGAMLIAASMGAVAFQKDLGATHSLAHPLSTECGLHHGLANAVCLPAVMRFNLEVSRADYARVAAIFDRALAAAPEAEAAAKAPGFVEALNARLGLPARLSECGVKEEHLATLAKKAFEDPCHATNPRPCTQADLMALYRECL